MLLPRYSVFKAIADPTRREIIHLLIIAATSLTISEIAANFNTTRQAVTKHLQILEGAGLIKSEKVGRQRALSIEITPLKEVYDWVGHYSKFWDDKLDALQDYLDT